MLFWMVYMTDLTELFTWTCSRCNDMTEGFEMVELIVDVQNCLQAFVGIAHDLNAIVIAFRGTQERRFVLQSKSGLQFLWCSLLLGELPGLLQNIDLQCLCWLLSCHPLTQILQY